MGFFDFFKKKKEDVPRMVIKAKKEETNPDELRQRREREAALREEDRKREQEREQMRLQQEAERKAEEAKRQVEARRRAEEQRKEQEQATANRTVSSNTNSLKRLVDKCASLEAHGQIPELQQCLFEIYSQLNKPGSGSKIINYPEKENLALCFAFMLQYDWVHDSDIREVWAEDGFYCIMEHLDHQSNGAQGQAEAMIILFTLLCAGRDSLKPKLQDILNKAKVLGNQVFHADDYRIGAQNVIDQISLLAVSGIRDMGPNAIPIMTKICQRYNGTSFFESTIKRTDLMKYDVMDVIAKARFFRDVIGSILADM